MQQRKRVVNELGAEIGFVFTAPVEGKSLKGRAGIDSSDPKQRRVVLTQLVQKGRRPLAGASKEDGARDPGFTEAAPVDP